LLRRLCRRRGHCNLDWVTKVQCWYLVFGFWAARFRCPLALSGNGKVSVDQVSVHRFKRKGEIDRAVSFTGGLRLRRRFFVIGRVSNPLHSVARTFGCLHRSFSGILSCLTHTLSGILSCLARTLSGRLRGLPCTFTQLSGSLARALAYFSGDPARAFTHLLGGLTEALADSFDRGG